MKIKIDDLLKQNADNHYKMVVIVDNGSHNDKIMKLLEKSGFTSYNVESSIIKILEKIPPEKHKLRIGDKIKDWVNGLPPKNIFFNTNILYSPDLGKLNPVNAFKYKARDREIIVFAAGKLSGNKIQYSEHGLPDYNEIDVSELIAIKLEDIDA